LGFALFQPTGIVMYTPTGKLRSPIVLI